MVRMYGSEAINAQKIIKQKESQVIYLQISTIYIY